MNQLGDEASPAPHTRIIALWRSHYGVTVGERAAFGVRELMARHFAALKALPGGELCEREALFITYADRVREDGIGPLQTLASFCEKRFPGIASGVHLLPSIPPEIYFHSRFGSRHGRATALESGIRRRINRRKLTLAELEPD